MRRTILVAAVLGVLVSSRAARAWVHEGEPAPAFSKSMLAGPPWVFGPATSLADYAGRVVVLFLLGCT